MNKTHEVYTYDQFFTTKEIALFCLKELKLIFKFKDFSKIVEPGAGEGSFFYSLPKSKRIGIEIDPSLCLLHSDYIQKPFLEFKTKSKKVISVGNPPFGNQNNLAIEFFNHAATFSSVIAFIVPRTWNKQSIHSRLDKQFHLVKSIDLPDNCFYGTKVTKVKCSFQIWKKENSTRVLPQQIRTHPDWDFVPYTKDDKDIYPPKEAHFAILAYGSNSGRISKDLFAWRPKSVHFIKSNIGIEELITRFESLDFTASNNTARQSSLCKADLIKLYSEKYK